MSAAMMTSPSPPWETASATLATGRRAGPRRDATPQVTRIAIPVVGAPIKGRHLVRAPWTEPLSAFAGVIVETQQVPDGWLRPRTPARRAIDPPLAAPLGARARPWVAIPVLPDTAPGAAIGPAVNAPAASTPDLTCVTTLPVRVVPAVLRPESDWTSLADRSHVVRPAPDAPAGPVATASPASPAEPTPGRRGLLGRMVTLTVGLVVSLVAVEVASRVGRR